MMKLPNCEMFVSFRLINSRAHFLQLIFACCESQILAVRDYLAMVAVVVVILIFNNEKLQLFCQPVVPKTKVPKTEILVSQKLLLSLFIIHPESPGNLD